jgi:uncharacterized membrane protein
LVTMMAMRPSPVRRLLSEDDERSVIEAIRAAESMTSGEIRVHIERRCGGEAMEAAQRWFARLGMMATRERNGILLYVAVDDRAFAIVGDRGIHERVGAAFWDGLRDILAEAFAKGDHAAGLTRAIAAAGAQLAVHFPRRRDDRNELPDTVST